MIVKGKFLMLLLALSITQCGCADHAKSNKIQFGQAIPENVELVKLKQIMEEPATYNNKEVLLEGQFAGICCESDFFYKEDFETIELSPQGFPSPKLIVGTPIRAYGIARVSGDRIRVEVKGVEVK